MSLHRNKLLQGWRHHNWLTRALIPVSLLYGTVSGLRRSLYSMGLLKTWQAGAPVIVVGNLTVGGTGKTPLVIYIADLLERMAGNRELSAGAMEGTHLSGPAR